MDGKLTYELSSNGVTFYFVPKTEEAKEADASAPALLTDVTLEDFAGVWTASTLEMLGVELRLYKMGIGIFLEIQGDEVHMGISEEMEDGSTADYYFEQKGVFADGVLSVNFEDIEMQVDLQLRSDGRLVLPQEEDGVMIYYVFDQLVFD